MQLTSRALALFAAVTALALQPVPAATPSAWPGPPVRLTAPALLEQVDIYRDSYGVPYVFSTTDKGAYFGAGYAAGSDRLFQMCVSRLRYQGRLSEFFGPGLSPANGNVNSDRNARLLGTSLSPAREAAGLQSTDTVTYGLLQAYADGVNKAIADVTAGVLPKNPLFSSANWSSPPSAGLEWDIPLDPWTVSDCIGVWGLLGGPYEGAGVDKEITAEGIVADNPGIPMQDLIVMVLGENKCDDQAAVIDVTDASVTGGVIDNVTAFQQSIGLPLNAPPTVCANGTLPHLSHTWAVRGTRVTTGKAVIVAEPRLAVTTPSNLYEWRMSSSAGLEVRGSGVPGSPNMLIGATNKVAWGATALGLDQADLFKVNVNRTNGTYLLNGVNKPFEVSIDSVIQVRNVTTGGFLTPVVASYRECYWGPLVNEVLGITTQVGDAFGNTVEYAAKAAPFSSGTGGSSPSATTAPVSTSAASRRMYKAQGVTGLRDSLATWVIPSLNFVFADNLGHIGYEAAGLHPVRSQSNALAGWVPLDGTTTTSDWMALTPNLAKPWVIDPAAGYILSANHAPATDWYTLNHHWGANGDSDRSRRLRERLSALLPSPSSPAVTPDAIADLRRDIVVSSLRDLAAVGKYMRYNQPTSLSSDAKTALRNHLEPWLVAGAPVDGSHPATTLVNFIALRIKGTYSFNPDPPGAIATYGAGGSALEYMLRKLSADILTPGFVVPPDEAMVIDLRIADAWKSLAGTGTPITPKPYWSAMPPQDPTQWAAWYAANESTRPIEPYAEAGPVDPFAGPAVVEGPAPCVHGSTIVSSFGAAYSYWMQVGHMVTYSSRLPMGESDSGTHAHDQNGLWLRNNNATTGPTPGLKSVLPGNAGTMTGTPVTLFY